MSAFPCRDKVICEGSDDPVANLTAEGYDLRTFFAIAHPANTWLGAYCNFLCESTVSQDAADLCARNIEQQAKSGLCDVPGADGSGGGGTPVIFWNTEQWCGEACPGGMTFYCSTPAHTVSAASQEQADAIAYSLACSNATAAKFCVSPTLMNCCLNTAFGQILSVSGGTAPFTWTLLSGTLPVGLSLVALTSDWRTVSIQGTPTMGGASTPVYSVRDARGYYVQGAIQVGSVSILPASLPDATQGVAYSQQLSVVGLLTGQHASYAVTSGTLPVGLTLSAAGLLSGTPTSGVPATFTIGVTIT